MEKLGNIYLYAKQTDRVEELQYVLQHIDTFYKHGDVYISREPRRSFSELEKVKEAMRENDICIITNPASLGLNGKDVVSQLEWFVRKPRILLMYDFNTTYLWGVSEPLNQAILQTIQQSVLEQDGKRIIKTPENRKSNSGRSRIEFPDNWAELYELWEKKEITSVEFLEKSGLKRATFYNMIKQYQQMQEENRSVSDKYKVV